MIPGGVEYTHDDDDRIGPLENSLPRPQMFHVMHVASQIQFEENARVTLPRGMTCSSLPASDEMRAPLPRATRASPQIGVGQTSMRQCFSSFLCCRGITYFSQVYQTSDSPSMMASSTKSELSAACTARRESLKILLGKGPHGSQTPRSIALTLLLPRSSSCKNNMQDISLLNAYAAIAQVQRSPNRPTNAVRESSLMEPEHFITNQVRFNLMCGEDDVGQFLKHVDMSNKEAVIPRSWDNTPAFCVSFVKNATVVCSGYAAIDDTGVISAQSAIHALQKSLAAIQMQFASDLVLPSACVHAEHVDVENASFLSMQCDLQWEFRKLFCPDPNVSVQEDVLDRFRAAHGHGDCSPNERPSLDAGRPRDRLVRISPPIQDANGCVSVADPSIHMLGMLLYSHQEQFNDYIRRCRLLVPKISFHGEWPVFGLHPPVEEEMYANVSVMYAQSAAAYVGHYLNLFSPRRQCGERVTEYENCRIARLQCVVEYIDQTLQRGLMVLPCTAASTTPTVPNASVVSSAFVRLMADIRSHVLQPRCGPVPLLSLQHSAKDRGLPEKHTSFSTIESIETQSARATKENDDGHGPFYSYLIGSQIGHPCITCGEAYDVIHANVDTYSCRSVGFYSIVNTAVEKFGRETPVKDVMDACARAMQKVDSLEDLVHGLTIADGSSGNSGCASEGSTSPRKRSRTPEVADYTHRFVTDERSTSFSRLLRLASMQPWKVTDVTFPLSVKHTMLLQDVLDDLLVPNGQKKTRARPTREECKRLYQAANAVSVESAEDKYMLPILTVFAMMECIVERIPDDLTNFVVHIIHNAPNVDKESSTMYTAMLNAAPLEFHPASTTTLLQPRPPSVCTVLIDMNTDPSTGIVHVATFKSFKGHCAPSPTPPV